jgi:tetratricopeptide (TPR) repeat protein
MNNYLYHIMTLDEIKTLAPAEAIIRLDAFIVAHPDNDEAYTLRGLRHWALQHRSLAINDYLAALSINPASRARQALDAANDILNYYNKDLYNP